MPLTHGAFDYLSGKKGKKVGSQGELACFSYTIKI